MIYLPWIIFTLGCIGLGLVGVRARQKELNDEQINEMLPEKGRALANFDIYNLMYGQVQGRNIGEPQPILGNKIGASIGGARRGSYGQDLLAGQKGGSQN